MARVTVQATALFFSGGKTNTCDIHECKLTQVKTNWQAEIGKNCICLFVSSVFWTPVPILELHNTAGTSCDPGQWEFLAKHFFLFAQRSGVCHELHHTRPNKELHWCNSHFPTCSVSLRAAESHSPTIMIQGLSWGHLRAASEEALKSQSNLCTPNYSATKQETWICRRGSLLISQHCHHCLTKQPFFLPKHLIYCWRKLLFSSRNHQ